MKRIDWIYCNDTKGYIIRINGDVVHFAESTYERDMFISELICRVKDRLKIFGHHYETQND